MCGGRAMSADASRALKVITGSSRFEASADEYTVAKAAAAVVDAYPEPTVTEDICRVHMAPGESNFVLRITWRLGDSAMRGAGAPRYTVLKMGESAGAAANKAYVYFPCRGPGLPDSLCLSHIAIEVRRWLWPHEPKGDINALKKAYATVAHSVALAMAKELRCEQNGGLFERPVLESA